MTGTVQPRFDLPDDDELIARALQDASIPTLMMSMIHMSGDASLLDGAIRPAGVFINEYQGYMSEEDKKALDELKKMMEKPEQREALEKAESDWEKGQNEEAAEGGAEFESVDDLGDDDVVEDIEVVEDKEEDY